MWFKRRYEVLLIGIARRILLSRNVARSMVVSRRDNNDMWAMAERLEAIESRMLSRYE